MAEVKIIKATKGEKGGCGRAVEQIRVAAYCRVSTDSEDQMNSYNSQVTYYTDLINQNPKWEMVDIYADAAITGTQVDKRDGFQSMIALMEESIKLLQNQSQGLPEIQWIP